ncbi:hypothetical protein N7478_012363 [Penicillium angulare]|uniref:uncharacterized protein n=1 Tax=Penicillium angulare TaxID=116970 RepID=UPI0025407D10|nr:uncharacterized protein N7478_012363 [Penicillium angulare]KAJ5259382.1 hypothetical protein N7478_012363 [Penicillium angulare]
MSKLARYAHNPDKVHFEAVKRVFRYLKDTKSLAISFSKLGDPLCGFVDSDWAGRQKHALQRLASSLNSTEALYIGLQRGNR